MPLAACSGGAVPPAGEIPARVESSVASTRTAQLLTLPIGQSPAGSASFEVPLASDALADSIGIDAQVPSLYGGADFPIVVSLVHSLGTRHIRDGIVNNDPSYDAAMAQMLGTTAKLDGITDCAGIAYNALTPTSAASIAQFDLAIGNGLETVEGPNEVDERGDPTWAQDTRACLPGLRAALPSLPFVGPSLADSPDNGATLGDISSLVDDGNFHRYFAGHNPGSLGWGGSGSCGAYGALTWAICEARVNSRSKPLFVTETGYNSQTEVDELTQAKYLSRTFLVNLKAGIVKTYIYVLRDYSGDRFGGDGLLRIDDSRKPSFTAIENEIAYFSDRGTAPSTNPLAYALSNTSLDHLLFRKRDGSYILALWNETTSWNTSNDTPVFVAPQKQIVSLPGMPNAVSAVAIGDTGAFVANPATVTGNAIALSVDDHVTLLHFTLP